MGDELKLTLKAFGVDDDLVNCEPLGNGHINTTFLCTTINDKKYVLQKINNHVFKDVVMRYIIVFRCLIIR